MADSFTCSDEDNRVRFERLLQERFPAVAAQMDEFERGLLHLEMEVFARATRAAIDRHDIREVQAHLGFINELFSDATPELVNAIYVSYLESVFLASGDEHYLAARQLLPERLHAALLDLEQHWAKIAEAQRHPEGNR